MSKNLKKIVAPILPEVVPGIGWVKPDHPLHPDYKKVINSRSS